MNIERFRPHFTAKKALAFGLAGFGLGCAAIFFFTGAIAMVLLGIATVLLFIARLLSYLRDSSPD